MRSIGAILLWLAVAAAYVLAHRGEPFSPHLRPITCCRGTRP